MKQVTIILLVILAGCLGYWFGHNTPVPAELTKTEIFNKKAECYKLLPELIKQADNSDLAYRSVAIEYVFYSRTNNTCLYIQRAVSGDPKTDIRHETVSIIDAYTGRELEGNEFHNQAALQTKYEADIFKKYGGE